MNNTVDFIIAYEGGELETEEEFFEGFQRLLDEGILFQLQGHYGRVGIDLLKAGKIVPKAGRVVRDYFGNILAVGVKCPDCENTVGITNDKGCECPECGADITTELILNYIGGE